MTPSMVLLVLAAYFLVLVLVARVTARGADNESFFIGNRKSPWYIVAFGMIGASLSGVTFISVPGWVENSQFSYMQMVLGYLVGYLVIGTVLMPLYYRLQLTSIYTYLRDRLGRRSYKTGAGFFLLSRIIGASFRLYLVALVLDNFVIQPLFGYSSVQKFMMMISPASYGAEGALYFFSFLVAVVVTIALIWLYTSKGGIKTIIWTDTLQTVCMLAAVVVAIVGITQALDFSFGDMIAKVQQSDYSRIFFFDDPNDSKFFPKQFLAGAFIAIAMTGLDQDMMQKNLSCKNIGEAQKNMLWFSIILVFVNLVFLVLGALLFMYGDTQGMTASGDKLFPEIAMNGGLGISIALFFIIGLVASAYSSADSALTALTTSFCVDILEIEKRPPALQESTRKQVHLIMSGALLIVILIFKLVNDTSVIASLFKAAGYTYGPLLGLYAFGMMTKLKVKDAWVPVVCIASPVICYVLNANSAAWFGGYQIGFEILLINGILTFVGLLILGRR
jgi:solute:Na+ symporter, SSS family